MDTLGNTGDRMPGADDDASGVAAILEIFTRIVESGATFKQDIYFIFYGAEELGFLGSKAVVRDFKKRKIAVSAVMQLDMIGYVHKKDMGKFCTGKSFYTFA